MTVENLTEPGTYWHTQIEEIVLVDSNNHFSYLNTFDDVVSVPMVKTDLDELIQIDFTNFNKFLDTIRADALRKASEDYMQVSTMYVKGWLLDQADALTNPTPPKENHDT